MLHILIITIIIMPVDEARKRTSYRNGDRYIYAKAPINPALPYTVHIAG